MKTSREEGLAIAERRKAARRRRTGRIRKAVAVAAVAAFIGPFAVIYAQVAAGKDPALATSAVAVNAATSVSNGTTSATESAKQQTTTTTSTTTTSTPAPVTTSQS